MSSRQSQNRSRHWSTVAFVLASCGALSCGNRNSPSFSGQSVVPATTSANVGSAPQSYADIVERVTPAVVTIRSARRVHAPQQFPFFSDPFFQQFFGNRGGIAPQQGRPEMQRALGSGVIVNADGHILTNHHVVDGAEQITVELSDRRTFQAKLVGSDAPSDLAVLTIAAGNLPPLALGDSDKVRVGDVCLAVGNPLGIGETVTAGIISAKGRATGLSDGSFEDFLQTDAAINQGNSGGALVNTYGQLIGINSQILSPSGGNIGLGFAIPSNMARNVTDQLARGGVVRRGMLGIGVQPVTSDLAAGLNLKDVRGVLVNSVEPGSPADQAGLRSGDVITAIDGTAVNDPNTLRNRIASTSPGTEVTLTVLRNGREQQMRARLASLSPTKQSNQTPPEGSSGGRGQLGVSVEPLTPEVAKQLGLRSASQGVVVSEIDPLGPAAEAGIQAGDVILEVNRQPVRSAADIKTALQRSPSSPALLLINRNGHNAFITVRPQ